MKYFLCWLLLVATALHADEIKQEGGVLLLTKDNFNTTIAYNEFVLVEFHAPWCVDCTVFEPEYAKIAQQFAEKKSSTKFGKVDTTVESELAEEYQIRRYPTLKFFRSGSSVEYSGGFQAADIIAWIIKKTGQPARELKTINEAEQFLKENEIAILGFFKDQESEAVKTLASLAFSLNKIVCGITSNDDVFSKYNAKDGAVMLFKPFDEKISVYKGEFVLEALKKFVKIESTPLIIENQKESRAEIFGDSKKSYLFLYVSKEAGHIERYVEPLKGIAKKYREDIVFIAISSDEEDNTELFQLLGVTKKELPTMRLINLQAGIAKYKPDSRDLSPDFVKDFLQKYTDGKLKKYLLSQELPEGWNKSPVKILVATNFFEFVLDSSKDVFVEFHASWCEDCKQLAPIYDQLGEKYKNNNKILISQIDISANELEDLEILSFPTFKLYRKGDNKVIDYNLDHTLENFIKFIDAGGYVAVATDSEHKKDEL